MKMSKLWQHPYVNVTKHFGIGEWKKCTKEGDVSTIMDKTTKGTVYRITGSIPAGNYIQFPHTSTQSLGLTGRYLYLLFRPIPSKFFAVHIDVATDDGLAVRISFSNLFKEFKSTATWLQFPFVSNPSSGSVDAAITGETPFSSLVGIAPQSSRWTLLVLDFNYILSIFLNRKYSHLKNIRLCANMFLKGLFTSDMDYKPGMSAAEARKLGLLGAGISPLPREMSFHLAKGADWHDVYDYIKFPADAKQSQFGVMTNLQRKRGDMLPQGTTSKTASDTKENRVHHPISDTKSRQAVASRIALVDRLDPQKQLRSKKRHHVIATTLPSIGLGRAHGTDDQTRQHDVHVFAHPRRQRSVQHKKEHVDELEGLEGPHLPAKAKSTNFKSLQPDPILSLRRIVGFGGATYRDALWTKNGACIVYPCHAVIVSMEVGTGEQQFFMGHTDKVSALALDGTTSTLASAQVGSPSVIRIWKFTSRKCVAMFRAPVQGIHCLSLSHKGYILCGVGKDSHNKQMVAVWDTSRTVRGGDVSLLAKAHTDVDICRMRIADFDDSRMISCGNDNIRLWRTRHGSLRSCAVDLGHHGVAEFTDVTFGPPTAPGGDPAERKLYSCTKRGTVYLIDYQKASLETVYRLLPLGSRREPVGRFGGSTPTEFGIALNALSVNEAFCVTGSHDGFLRLWPLDFSSVYLEAEHEGPVTAVDVTKDGSQILAGTSSGNLGVLNTTDRSYTTLMRSHTDTILCMAFDATRRHLATVSSDQTIRVWDMDTLAQLFDFRAPGEDPCTIAYHPQQQCFACGFVDGNVRVFHVGTTNLLAEHKQHRGKVTGLAFSPNGEYLYSAGSQGALALYDGSGEDFQLIRMLLNTVARGETIGHNVLSVSGDSLKLAFLGPSGYTVTVVDARSLDEILRVDVTAVSHNPENAEVDTAVNVCFAPPPVNQLLVVTSSSRLLKLDSHNGLLLSEVANIHRSGCSSVDVSADGRFLATAGDRVLKIWDYHMRLDLNFQVFIGHAEKIQQVGFTPDSLCVVSIGEAVLLWNFLGGGRKPASRTRGREPAVSYVPRSPDRSVKVSAEKPYNSEVKTPLTGIPTVWAPHTGIPRRQAPVPQQYEPLHLDMTPIYDDEGPVDLEAQENGLDEEELFEASSSPGHRISPLKAKPATRIVNVDDLPSKVHASETTSSKSIQHEMPRVCKHYKRHRQTSSVAQRRYIAPPNQAGLKLMSVLGYNGGGRGNMIWKHDTGLFAYTSGSIVVVENLHSGTQRHFIGHGEEISTLSVQHDGLILASASGSSEATSSQISIWNVCDGVCKKVVSYHSHEVVCLAYSRDDRFLISVGDYHECSVVVWSTSDYVVLTTSYAKEPLHDLLWDPYTVNEFVSVGQNGTVLFWLLDETSGTVGLNVYEAEVPEELLKSRQGQEEGVHFTAVCYAGDSVLYAATSTGVLSAWDTRQNKCFMHWNADSAEIDELVCNGGVLITGGSTGNLRLWSVVGVGEMKLPGDSYKLANDGLVMEDEMTLGSSVTSIAFDESLETGIVGTAVGTLWYINWSERTSIRLVSGHSQQINSMVFSGPDDKFFATCSNDGVLHLWTTDNLEHLQFQVMEQTCNCVAFCPVPPPTPTISVTNEGQTIATVHPSSKPEELTRPSHCVAGYSDGTVRVFDLGKVEMIVKMQPHASAVTKIAFSGDGRVVISGGSDGLLAISSPSTGLTLRVLSDHRGAPITDLHVTSGKDQQFSLSCPVLWLAASADRRVSVWSADWTKDFCELVDWLTFPAPPIAPDGRALEKGDPSQYNHLPPSLAKFSPAEPDIVVYTGYGMCRAIQFYSLSQRKVVRTAALTHWATSMDMSPKGHLIALGTGERLVKLMDYKEGSFQDFIGHCDGVSLVQFSPSGSLLYSAGFTDILIWQTNV